MRSRHGLGSRRGRNKVSNLSGSVQMRELRAGRPEPPRGLLVMRRRRGFGGYALDVEEAAADTLDLRRRRQENGRPGSVRRRTSHEREKAEWKRNPQVGLHKSWLDDIRRHA